MTQRPKADHAHWHRASTALPSPPSPEAHEPLTDGRQRVEAELTRRVRLERLITGISAQFIVLDASRIDAAIGDALQSVAEAIEVDHGYICRVEGDPPTTRLTHEWCAGGTPQADGLLQEMSLQSFPWLWDRLHTHEPVVLSRIEDVPPEAAATQGFLAGLGATSFIAVPLSSGSSLLGFLAFATEGREATWSPDGVALLRFVGDILVNAIDRKGTQAALRDGEERLEATRQAERTFARVFHSSPLAISISALEDGRFIDVNDGFLRATDYTRDEVIGRTALELGLWERAEDRERFIRALRERGVIRGRECTLRTKLGVSRTVALSAELLDLGGQESLLCFVEDVTERKQSAAEQERLEALLSQSQKMEALGQLAGGLAHDFNNVLTAILGNAELMLEKLDATTPEITLARVEATLEQIRQAGEQGATMTRQLLAFSRKQDRKVELLNPNRIVEDMQQLLRRLIGEHIALETQLEPDVAPIFGDSGQIEQVVLNLALNARDAMPQGGRLRIETANVHLSRDDPARRVEGAPGRQVMLRVCDDGCGMSREVLERIFEPFFTTKPEGKGTGLGLATAYGIVKQSGGVIKVDSEPGQGTTFAVFFPAAEGEAAHEVNHEVEPKLRGDETILLCEDDAMVRQLAAHMLESGGYTVLTARNGREALELLELRSEPIQLLVSDTVMPEMNGAELAGVLTRRDPELRVLLVTGYDSGELECHGVAEGEAEMLHKPFSATSLLRRVRDLLDR